MAHGNGRRRRGWVDNTVPDLWTAVGTQQSRLTLSRMSWPAPSRFPANHASSHVDSILRPDLMASSAVLAVVGFASIEQLVELVAARSADPRDGVRVLLGWEPFISQRVSFGSATASFDDEVRRYWIEQEGVSLRSSAKIVQTLNALEAGHLQVRFVPGHDRLHAKVYLADRAATLGSSNFTRNGLRTQLEANARFDRLDSDGRYEELRTIGENFWQIGQAWDEPFAALLRDLLKFVSWPEALARACADLLEGHWADRFLSAQPGGEPLWPSQRFGIAEALWVVENVGSVLVADATGSGKTRMGAHLTAAVRNRLWSTGRVRRDLTVVVCPKAVEADWLREAVSCGLTARTVAQSLLSQASPDGPRLQEREVAEAQILAVDEAHNFLTASRRTRFVRESSADHVLMFTATPINRGASDLLSLVDLLGADNFDDATLKVLDNLGRRGRDGILADQEKALLRAEIQRFTVRRTKNRLNGLVADNPEAYRDPSTGRICRYPEHRSSSYRTGESTQDVALAAEIREHAHALTGVGLLGNQLLMPPGLRREMTDEHWLELRLGSARGLAAHHVLSALRSSKAALIEHLRGTAVAVVSLEVTNLVKAQPTGNQIGAVGAVRERGRPTVDLRCKLPVWLTDDDAWLARCEEDLEHYLAIERCARELDASREQAKAEHLLALSRRHSLVLAFDRHPITLAVLGARLAAAGVDVEIATGADKASQKRVTRQFALGSTHRGVALCSDAMNEGINLQGASCIVHLDMPTTLRVAEQRVGRVDRMNSPHAAVEVWWPNDGAEFATRADELLATRNIESSQLLGSNLPIPSDGNTIIDHSLFSQTRDEDWDGLYDALEPVRRLVSGEDALVPPDVYEDQQHARERVMSRVSPVRSSVPWAFFAIAGTAHGAPRWLVLEGSDSAPTTGLPEVTARLRALLAEDPPQRDFDGACEYWLERFLDAAARAEIALLPRRDQRALAQMATCARTWASAARFAGDREEAAARWDVIGRIARGETDEGAVDLHETAAIWRQLTRTRRDEYRAAHRRRRYLTLSDLDQDLAVRPLDLTDVESGLSGLSVIPTLDRRISACILAVP
ncbi:SNF2-related protein [Cellulomonas alba]|uniref:Helicase-related protein n=1 Tax=Cellulomonas alba TaxID=3053467 RepID=A0ABT7SI12_9CELL|nr:helicase-related protein [Cellulomonas alba]MDM7855810.1 helicase-related protein [Cellulomonas alba]